MPHSVPELERSSLSHGLLDEPVFGHCRLGLEDFAHAIRHEPRTRTLMRLAMGGGAAAGVGGAWLTRTAHARAGWVLLGLGLACFAAYHLPDRIAQNWFARTPPRARLVKYTLGAQGLIVASELSPELHPWSKLEGYQEAPDSFLIWVSHKLFVIVPKRAFAAADLPRVVAQLEQRIGAPPALPRFWSTIGIFALLAVLGLGLWNWLSPR